MVLDITDQEREFLLELLETRRTSMLHELHHTDTNYYKEMLKEKLELLEGVKAKVETISSTNAA